MPRNVLLLATVLVAACQSTGTPTLNPEGSTAVASPVASAAPSAAFPSVAAPSTAPTKPVTLPRTVDVPLDGTCEDANISCLGTIEAGKTYSTKVFEPTMSFVVQTTDWVNPFDTGGEFGLLSKRDIGDGIWFFRDARSVDKSVGATALDIATWMETYSNLDVTPFVPAKIGGLNGVWMDVRVAPGATSTDPGCPVQTCVLMLRGDDPVPNDPYQWHWDWGNAGTEVQRVYLLEDKGTVIVIFVDSPDGLTFDALTNAFDEIAPTIAFN